MSKLSANRRKLLWTIVRVLPHHRRFVDHCHTSFCSLTTIWLQLVRQPPLEFFSTTVGLPPIRRPLPKFFSTAVELPLVCRPLQEFFLTVVGIMLVCQPMPYFWPFIKRRQTFRSFVDRHRTFACTSIIAKFLPNQCQTSSYLSNTVEHLLIRWPPPDFHPFVDHHRTFAQYSTTVGLQTIFIDHCRPITVLSTSVIPDYDPCDRHHQLRYFWPLLPIYYGLSDLYISPTTVLMIFIYANYDPLDLHRPSTTILLTSIGNYGPSDIFLTPNYSLSDHCRPSNTVISTTVAQLQSAWPLSPTDYDPSKDHHQLRSFWTPSPRRLRSFRLTTVFSTFITWLRSFRPSSSDYDSLDLHHSQIMVLQPKQIYKHWFFQLAPYNALYMMYIWHIELRPSSQERTSFVINCKH